jgi:hypothetical protein
VALGAFPLAFAVVLLICVLSRSRAILGLRTELILLGIVIGVRLLGMASTHSTETAKLLIPESVLVALTFLALHVEHRRSNR